MASNTSDEGEVGVTEKVCSHRPVVCKKRKRAVLANPDTATCVMRTEENENVEKGLRNENHHLRAENQGLHTEIHGLRLQNQGLSVQNESIRTAHQSITTENQRLTTTCIGLKIENQGVRTEIEGLRIQNQGLSIQNESLQTALESTNTELRRLKITLSNLNKQLAKFGHASSDLSNLPTIILVQIFENLRDTKSLLASRLVCSSWRCVIDSTASIMRRLTFRILHPLFFLDLVNIVPGVRSIKFELSQTRPSSDADLQNMVAAIAPTLESVAFDFDLDGDLDYDTATKLEQQHRQVAFAVLSNCDKINELRLLGRKKSFMRGLNFTDSQLSRITSLTVNTGSMTPEDNDIYKALLLSLKKLSSLSLICFAKYDVNDSEPVLSPLCEHMNTNPGMLKKFTHSRRRQLPDIFETSSLQSQNQVPWTKLMLTAGKYGVHVTLDHLHQLRNLLEFTPSEKYPINLNSCSTITLGKIWLGTTYMDIGRLDLCENLQELHIESGLHVNVQLRFLWRLKNLHKLKFSNCTPNTPTTRICILDETLTLPSVRSLCIFGKTFESTAVYYSLSTHFPSLVNLALRFTEVPAELFVCLAKLERLRMLDLVDLPMLNDSSFSALISLANLKELEMRRMGGLTDGCLTNGIALHESLERLNLIDCLGFTDVGYKAITSGRLKKMTISSERKYWNPMDPTSVPIARSFI